MEGRVEGRGSGGEWRGVKGTGEEVHTNIGKTTCLIKTVHRQISKQVSVKTKKTKKK